MECRILHIGCLLIGISILPVASPARGGTGQSPCTEDADLHPWRSVHQRAGVSVYRRDLPDRSLPEFLAVLSFEQPPQRVLDVLIDYGRFAEFLPYVRQSRVLRRSGKEQWVWQRLSFPGPLADRVYVLHSRHGPLPQASQGLRITWRLSDAPAPISALAPAGGIPPQTFQGAWHLFPLEHGTLGCYRVYLDPGGRMPRWLTRRLLPGHLVRIVEAVRRRLADLGAP